MGPPAEDFGAPEFRELVAEVRRLQDAVSATAAPSAALSLALAEQLRAAAEQLEDLHTVGRLRASRLNGGGHTHHHPVLVPYQVGDVGERTMWATTTFTEAHLGGNGAVHGGMIPLMFDDLLGIFVSERGLSGSRTAYLKVNYRKITPILRPLRVEASIDSVEGRKTKVTGRLYDGDELLCDADALFVRLLPGQP
ncbi:PaaI family thioesterase [Tomitella biformata]|uniref:PaaI family thioesterase n=1 Tax=Tomitella biformata TaxID=630403 RepID=UPI000463F5B4|nr:PaaI family thioesterase [Tomitella biformata]